MLCWLLGLFGAFCLLALCTLFWFCLLVGFVISVFCFGDLCGFGLMPLC